MKRIYLLAVLAALALSGCAAQQTFSEVSGDLRVTGTVVQNLLSPQSRTLSLSLANAATGNPLDASEVEVRAGNARPVRAKRKQTGTYTADFSDADRVEVLIVTSGRAAVIALVRQ